MTRAWFFSNYGAVHKVPADGEVPGFGPVPFARDYIELGVRVLRERNDEQFKLAAWKGLEWPNIKRTR